MSQTQTSSNSTPAWLKRAPYCSLATFRRNGAKVATPVWFAPGADGYYVFSAGNAGKVKRLRNSAQAEVAECDVRGKLLGGWHNAQATLIAGAEDIEAALAALRKKYGWQMWLADVGARLTGRYHARAYIHFKVDGAQAGTPPATRSDSA